MMMAEFSPEQPSVRHMPLSNVPDAQSLLVKHFETLGLLPGSLGSQAPFYKSRVKVHQKRQYHNGFCWLTP